MLNNSSPIYVPVPADVIATDGARPSAGKMMITKLDEILSKFLLLSTILETTLNTLKICSYGAIFQSAHF